jgi:hypothetical protein
LVAPEDLSAVEQADLGKMPGVEPYRAFRYWQRADSPDLVVGEPAIGRVGENPIDGQFLGRDENVGHSLTIPDLSIPIYRASQYTLSANNTKSPTST